MTIWEVDGVFILNFLTFHYDLLLILMAIFIIAQLELYLL